MVQEILEKSYCYKLLYGGMYKKEVENALYKYTCMYKYLSGLGIQNMATWTWTSEFKSKASAPASAGGTDRDLAWTQLAQKLGI